MAVKSLIKRNYDKQPQLNYPDYKSSILRAPKKDKVFFSSSPSEVSGPIFKKNIIGKRIRATTEGRCWLFSVEQEKGRINPA